MNIPMLEWVGMSSLPQYDQLISELWNESTLRLQVFRLQQASYDPDTPVERVSLSMLEAKYDYHSKLGPLDEFKLAETTLISLSCIIILSSRDRCVAFHK